jgi:hypothetical protein
MKHKIGEEIFYLKNNKIHSGIITSLVEVKNKYSDDKFYNPFGPERTEYMTSHGIFDESVVFKSREELINSL